MNESPLEILQTKRCPECGKEFYVAYPDKWVYRRQHRNTRTYYCSWRCYRVPEKKKEESKVTKVTLEQKKKAVEIALEGGDPREFLGTLCKAPGVMWSSIREKLKTADPELYEKLPKAIPHKNAKHPWRAMEQVRREEYKEKHQATKTAGEAMENIQGAVDEFFGKCEEMGLKLDKEETEDEPESEEPKIFQPVNYDGMVVREVEGGFGRYRRSDVGQKIYIDFEPADDCLDTLSYTVEQWRSFRKEHERAAVILGVEM